MSDHPNSLSSKVKREAIARGCSSGSSIKERLGFLLSPQGSSQQQGDYTCGNSSLSTGASCWDAISCFLWVVPHPLTPNSPLALFFIPLSTAHSALQRAHRNVHVHCHLGHVQIYSQDIFEAFSFPVIFHEIQPFTFSLWTTWNNLTIFACILDSSCQALAWPLSLHIRLPF